MVPAVSCIGHGTTHRRVDPTRKQLVSCPETSNLSLSLLLETTCLRAAHYNYNTDQHHLHFGVVEHHYRQVLAQGEDNTRTAAAAAVVTGAGRLGGLGGVNREQRA